MKQSGIGSRVWRRPILLAALLAACLSLLVGFAWARYQTSETQSLQYAVKDYASIHLWESFDPETETFQRGQLQWDTVETQKILMFCVSNGTGVEYAEDDQRIFIRLIAGPGAQILENNMQISLDIAESGESVSGAVSPILEGSPLHSTFGPGWVVTFPDDDGTERSWTLPGGELSVLSAQLTLWNAAIQDPTLLQLQVMGDAAVG